MGNFLWRALDLVERSQLAQKQLAEYDAPGSKILDRWRRQKPFDQDTFLQQRLDLAGLTLQSFTDILTTPDESLVKVIPQPDWLRQLLIGSQEAPSILPPPEQGIIDYFLMPVRPLVAPAIEALNAKVQELPIGTHENFWPSLQSILARKVFSIVSRTLILEMNIARIHGRLRGSDPKERFRDYFRQLENPAKVLQLAQEYPVLFRKVQETASAWASFSNEFIERLTDEWGLILSEIFSGRPPGNLTHASSTGDSHCKGRSVIILSFEGGCRLAYKPRSLTTDLIYQKIVGKVNRLLPDLSLRTIKTLDRQTHGWAEFIPYKACESEEQVGSFYSRQGRHLALLYFLGATDLHHENIIAHGEHPVLIDLETLFHPRFPGSHNPDPGQQAATVLAESVLGLGLLPTRFWSNLSNIGVDLSGMGGEAGQMSPHRELQIEGIGTDEMSISEQHVPIPERQNRPSLEKSTITPSDYHTYILDGFCSMYRTIVQNRDLIFSQETMDEISATCIRVIVRPTRTYGLILQNSYHPDNLRDALSRDLLLDRLWLSVPHRPFLQSIISYEFRDLSAGDIPYFTTTPASTGLRTSTGELISDILSSPGVEIIKNRLNNAGNDDMTRQTWVIKASLVTSALDSSPPIEWLPLTFGTQEGSPEVFLECALKIGSQLSATAFTTKSEANWIGLQYHLSTQSWLLKPLTFNLYSGQAGIALFLAYLGYCTGETKFKELAEMSCASALQALDDLDLTSIPHGAYEGTGGVLYALAHLSVIWDREDLLLQASSILNRIEPLNYSHGFDLISGTGGLIGCLSVLLRVTGDLRIISHIEACADLLLAKARRMDKGIAWDNALAGKLPLTGFSHGVAGGAWALMRAYELTGQKRFRDGALGALEYESSLFDGSAGNWEDLQEYRVIRPRSRYLTTWCHGAPGIGISRLEFITQIQGTRWHDELHMAIKTTLREGFGRSHCLCHGDLGNLDFLLEAAYVLNDEELLHKSRLIGNSIRERGEENGFACGVPLSIETPGLMVGLAGIGYEFLRLAFPDRVPSVLTLQPPRAAILASSAGLSRTAKGKNLTETEPVAAPDALPAEPTQPPS